MSWKKRPQPTGDADLGCATAGLDAGGPDAGLRRDVRSVIDNAHRRANNHAGKPSDGGPCHWRKHASAATVLVALAVCPLVLMPTHAEAVPDLAPASDLGASSRLGAWRVPAFAETPMAGVLESTTDAAAVPEPAALAQRERRRDNRNDGSTSARAIDRAMVEAAVHDDAEGVLDLIDAGANVNAAVKGDGTALLIAARHGNRRLVDELLRRGADVNIPVSGDGSALIMAARGGHLEIVHLLLDRGADINLGVEGDGNALIMAAREGHTRIVQLLLDKGALVDEVVSGDENALISASGAGRLDVVRLLVSHGANVNARVWAEHNWPDPRGEWRTPLGQARRGNHAAVERYLQLVGATD